jgi:glutamyl-tRNA synthetase
MSADPAASKKEQKKAVKGEKKDVVYAYTVNLSKDKSVEPALTRAVELYFGEAFPKTRYAYYLDGKKSLPTLTVEGRADSSVSGDVNIARFIVRSNAALASFYGGSDLLLASQIDQWLDLYSFSLISGGYQQSLSELLESFLATRTFLVGHSFSLADLAIYVAAKRANSSALGPNASRWFSLVASYVPDLSVPIPIQFIAPPKKESAKVEKTAAVAEVATTNAAIEDGGTCPPLENAVEGQVCTRFPPEPSGYLHIGHAKAVLLNQYYAQRYNGKLIVRFDDTNPSKEKEEFEENILHDLNTLGVKPDKVSARPD